MQIHPSSLLLTCKTSSGVEIIPPHLVTLALVNELLHLNTSSLSIASATARIAGFDILIALMKSFNSCSSLFCSLIINRCSVRSCWKSFIFCCCVCIRALSSLTQLWSFSSSLGMMRPQPCSQGNGLLGLCSHSSRWAARVSSLRTRVQPYWALSQFMHNLEN